MKKNHPFRCLLKKEFESFRENTGDAEITVLYCASSAMEMGRPKTQVHTCVKILSRVGEEEYNKAYSDWLCNFFAFMHHHTLPPTSITPYGYIPVLSTHDLFDHSVENYTPLLVSLYGLATGRASCPLEKITSHRYQDFQSQYIACVVGCDMLKRCAVTYPCHFQVMLGQHIEGQKNSRPLKDVLSAYHTCPSWKFSDRKKCTTIVSGLLKGVHKLNRMTCACSMEIILDM